MKDFDSRIALVRRAAIDACVGLAIFVVLAFGVTLDRTGGVAAFHNVPQFVPAQANAIEFKSDAASGAYQRGPRDDAASVATVVGHVSATHQGVDMAFARTDQTTAIVLLGGIFLGIVLPRIPRRKRKRWGNSF